MLRIPPDIWSKADPSYITLTLTMAAFLIIVDSVQLRGAGMGKEAKLAKCSGYLYIAYSILLIGIRRSGG